MSKPQAESNDGLVQIATPLQGARSAVASIAFGIFLILIAGTPILDAFRQGPPPKLTGAEKLTAETMRAKAKWMNGTRAAIIAADLKDNSEVRRLALPYWATTLWRVFGEVNRALVGGSEDWIFLRERAKTNPLSDARLIGLVAATVACADRRIAAQGIDPIVLLIPRKETVANDHLPKVIMARPHLDAAVLRATRAHGVRVPDLEVRFSGHKPDAIYHKSDSHWNDSGSLIAAQAVASMLGIANADERGAELKREPFWYETGDALRMSAVTRVDRTNPLGAGEWDVRIRPPKSPDIPWDEKATPPMTDLALLGTSFSAHSRLRANLSWLTKQPIWSGARPGMGPMVPLEDLIKKRPGGVLPKRLVWEIPLNYLICLSVPLDRLANFIAIAPAPNVDQLASTGSLNGLMSQKSTLVPGNHTLNGELIAKTNNEAILHPGTGVLAYRIRGLASADAQIMTVSEGTRIIAPWRAGVVEIVVPVIAWKRTSECSVHLRAPKGTVVRVDSVELVTDCRRDTAELSAPWLPHRLDHVVVDVDATNKQTCAFTVTAFCSSGKTVTIGTAAGARPDSKHYFAVASCVDESIVKLDVVSDNPKALVTVKRAPWIAPVAPTDSRPK